MSYVEDPAYTGKAFLIIKKCHRESDTVVLVKHEAIAMAEKKALEMAKS